MVGDEDKDLVSKRIGIHTFLINSHNTKLGIDIPEPDYRGTLEDLKQLL